VVPADGVLVEGSMVQANEEMLTGNPRVMDKSDEFPFLLSGAISASTFAPYTWFR
jgi:magnesium-transporting ATPase (P-type)